MAPLNATWPAVEERHERRQDEAKFGEKAHGKQPVKHRQQIRFVARDVLG
jgi:hypothetical protein